MKKLTLLLLLTGLTPLMGTAQITPNAGCVPITPPYTQDFSAGVPPNNCWRKATGTATFNSVSNGPATLDVGNFYNSSSKARIDLSFGGKRDWLISPIFDLSGGAFQVSFDLTIASLPVAGLSPDDELRFLISLDSGATWSTIELYDRTWSLARLDDSETYDLSAYTGKNVQFAFWASEYFFDDRFNSTVDIDNFMVDGTVSSLSVVSDDSWRQSTVVTTATSNSYPWPGVSSVPASTTFTLLTSERQPYPWVSIYSVEGSEVLFAHQGVTYFRKEFQLTTTPDMDVRFRMFVDDNMQIFINGHAVALEDGMGVANFRTANHDILFGDGFVDNGYSGGDAFDYYTSTDMNSIFVDGQNEIVLAIRNRTSKVDLGGFSFRMDVNKNTVLAKYAEATSAISSEGSFAADIFPNPTQGKISITPSNLDENQDLDILVLDISGKVVMIENYSQISTDEMVSINLSDLAKGVYSLKLKNGDAIIMKKIIVN